MQHVWTSIFGALLSKTGGAEHSSPVVHGLCLCSHSAPTFMLQDKALGRAHGELLGGSPPAICGTCLGLSWCLLLLFLMSVAEEEGWLPALGSNHQFWSGPGVNHSPHGDSHPRR